MHKRTAIRRPERPHVYPYIDGRQLVLLALLVAAGFTLLVLVPELARAALR